MSDRDSSSDNSATIAAVVTAGGRISGDFAARAGVGVKALCPLGGGLLIDRILGALRAVPAVGPIAVVGPVEELSKITLPPDTFLVAEGATGPENVGRGIRAVHEYAPNVRADRLLLCTSDLPFVDGDAVRALLNSAPADADIVYPVVTREAYLAAFPGSPNTFARLAGREYTGGSVLVVNPDALTANRHLIEAVFAARKSQIAMARLLGLSFTLRFLTNRLTIERAERRASQIIGCACRALREAPPTVCADIDTAEEYEWVLSRLPADKQIDV